MERFSRPKKVWPIVLREVSVLERREVTANMLRLTLGGPEMLGCSRDGVECPPFVSVGFDDHVKLVIPHADGQPIEPGTQLADRVQWGETVLQYCRDYTVRKWHEDATSFDIEVVRHAGGRAAEWAYQAQIGDRLTFAGPKLSSLLSPLAEWHLLVADETGLPAVARWLEEAAPGQRAKVIVEVASPDDVQEIATVADADITWLVRGGGVEARASHQLAGAVAAFAPWAGRGFVWGGAETSKMSQIRQFVRRRWGFAAADVDLVGYW